MKNKLLFLLFLTISFINLNAQTIVNNGNPGIFQNNRGGHVVDSVSLTPVRNSFTAIYPLIPYAGRIQYYTGDNRLYYHNNSSWVSPLIPADTINMFLPISYVPAWSSITGKPSFATLATSGSYLDLSDKPTIYAFTGSNTKYTKGDGTYATFPTTVSSFTNDAGYLTTVSFSSLTGKPTTLSGYGITDAYPLSGNPSGFISNLSSFTTSNLTEGVNLYWTSGRFNTAFSGKSTTDLFEGANLYFTNVRARLAISLTTNGSGPATYDNSTGVINIPRNTIYYNSSGVVNQVIKKWTGIITPSTASGQTVDISSASFGTILSVQVYPVQNVSTVKGGIAVGKTVSTTSLSINIYSSKNTGVLIGGNIEGLEFHPSPSSVSLYVEVTEY